MIEDIRLDSDSDSGERRPKLAGGPWDHVERAWPVVASSRHTYAGTAGARLRGGVLKRQKCPRNRGPSARRVSIAGVATSSAVGATPTRTKCFYVHDPPVLVAQTLEEDATRLYDAAAFASTSLHGPSYRHSWSPADPPKAQTALPAKFTFPKDDLDTETAYLEAGVTDDDDLYDFDTDILRDSEAVDSGLVHADWPKLTLNESVADASAGDATAEEYSDSFEDSDSEDAGESEDMAGLSIPPIRPV